MKLKHVQSTYALLGEKDQESNCPSVTYKVALFSLFSLLLCYT